MTAFPNRTPKEEREYLAERLLLAELRSTLARWGDWIERHRDDTGLPTQAAFTNIPSGEEPGHRILCAEMPKKVAAVHRAIYRLQEHDRFMLMIWYGFQRDKDDHWLDGAQKADLLGISYITFRVEVHHARKALMALKEHWMV